MGKCIFSEECNGKYRYGKYCNKHKSNYLMIEDKINIFNFTSKESDYLKNDLVKYHDLYFTKKRGEKKIYYFEKVLRLKLSLDLWKNHEIKLVKVQSLIRRYLVILKLRKDCKNEEDFYTYDRLHEIDDKYYYAYYDNNNNKWGFDIRSLYKLIQNTRNNPYTMNNIPDKIIEDINNKVVILKRTGEYRDIQDTFSNYKIDNIKQKCVDLFVKIENIGHSCSIEWFMDLNKFKLIRLYRNLEDIWNYRASLNTHIKKMMIPPNGELFRLTNDNLNGMTREDLLSIILNEIIKFESGSDYKLGYLYFIIGLSTVNIECYNTHSWLNFV